MSCLCSLVLSVFCNLSCQSLADILAPVCDVYCDIVTFAFGILGQVWYLIVSISNPCCLSYLSVFKNCLVCATSSICFLFIVISLFYFSLRQWTRVFSEADRSGDWLCQQQDTTNNTLEGTENTDVNACRPVL